MFTKNASNPNEPNSLNGPVAKQLMSLGITPNYTGYDQAVYAVTLSSSHPEFLREVSTRLYPAVAEHCGTSWKAVERNLRTIINTAWETNPALLAELSGRPLSKKPTSGQFIATLTAQIADDPMNTPHDEG